MSKIGISPKRIARLTKQELIDEFKLPVLPQDVGLKDNLDEFTNETKNLISKRVRTILYVMRGVGCKHHTLGHDCMIYCGGCPYTFHGSMCRHNLNCIHKELFLAEKTGSNKALNRLIGKGEDDAEI